MTQDLKDKIALFCDINKKVLLNVVTQILFMRFRYNSKQDMDDIVIQRLQLNASMKHN